MSSVEPVLRFDVNECGRDFVVGDIHGMFTHLDGLLDQVGFDEGSDRLFSVGDLVDRGPDSACALAWLDKPWFHACRGNHEQFALDSVHDEQRDIWIHFNGGGWWLELDEDAQTRFREAFRALPLAMEVRTASGVVGIVHADVPPMLSWERFLELLSESDHEAALYALWSRNRITGSLAAERVAGGVDRIYCGHTPTRHTVQLHNVWYIDTGAVYCYEGFLDARLTLVEIQPGPHMEHGIDTHPEKPGVLASDRIAGDTS